MTTTIDAKPLAFKVHEQALFTSTQRIDTHKAIVRTDSNAVLGIVGKEYTYVQNEDLLRPFYDALKSAGLGKLIVEPRLYNNGAWWRCDFIAPTLRAEPAVNDIVEFRTSVINSFDGSGRVQTMSGARRLMCLNGMTMGVFDYSTSHKHTKGLTTYDFTQNIGEAIDAFAHQQKHWQEWVRHDVSPKLATFLIEQLWSEQMVKRHQQAIQAARNLWDVYNIATAWASREDVQPVRVRSDRGTALALHNREVDVFKWAKLWPTIISDWRNDNA